MYKCLTLNSWNTPLSSLTPLMEHDISVCKVLLKATDSLMCWMSVSVSWLFLQASTTAPMWKTHTELGVRKRHQILLCKQPVIRLWPTLPVSALLAHKIYIYTWNHLENTEVLSHKLYVAFTCCVYFLICPHLSALISLTHNSPNRCLFLSS